MVQSSACFLFLLCCVTAFHAKNVDAGVLLPESTKQLSNYTKQNVQAPASMVQNRSLLTKKRKWFLGRYELLVEVLDGTPTSSGTAKALTTVLQTELTRTIKECSAATSKDSFKTSKASLITFSPETENTSTFQFTPKIKYKTRVPEDSQVAKCVRDYFGDMQFFLSVLQSHDHEYVKRIIKVMSKIDGKELDSFPRRMPNIIVMQPDDLPFFDEPGWMSPPKSPGLFEKEEFPNNYTMPNLERLRSQGLQMEQAYTVSTTCGTSRYGTITGKYASRSAYSRDKNKDRSLSQVTIPTTKLEDVGDEKDCSKENLAALFKANGYRTGFSGKWHLSSFDEYTYSTASTAIKSCGFDFADGIFVENLDSEFFEDHITHNMEWVTDEAIKFIRGDDGSDLSKPFFLYFNPTAPHLSGNVLEALEEKDCRDTPKGRLPEEPVIKGMTAGYDCKSYRKTILDRAGTETSNAALGSIWVDDSIGALIQELEHQNMLDNTIILFQIDHGMGAKRSLYEGGSRIAQFIHYPNEFGTNGLQFSGVVANIDIGPTLMDYAGFLNNPKGKYDMDGISWKDAVGDSKEEAKWQKDRCLLFELGFDRAVRCGCEKYISIGRGFGTKSETLRSGRRNGYPIDNSMFFNLCDEEGTYINYPATNPEKANTIAANTSAESELINVLECFLEKTNPQKPKDYSTLCTRKGLQG